MPLSPDERTVLADVCDELDRSDPRLAESFGRLRPRHSGWWWAASLTALAIVAAAIGLLGPIALGALAMLLVVGSPLAVALAPRAGDGPPERF